MAGSPVERGPAAASPQPPLSGAAPRLALALEVLGRDLVDELRLVVFPVVLGAGERLFGETSDKKPMRLVDTKTIGDGLVFLTYEFVREA